MLRYSLGSLFGLVLLAALACAALVYASTLVKQIAVTLTVLVLGLAALVAIVTRGRPRAIAAGCAFAGWAYFLLANVSAVDVEQHLLTRNVNNWLYVTLHQEEQPPSNTALLLNAIKYQEAQLAYLQALEGAWSQPQGAAPLNRQTFGVIAHSVWALLLALLGAVAAAVIHACGRQQHRPTEA